LIKLLSLFILLVLIVSCNEEEIASYNDLSTDEQTAIRAAAQIKCLSESSSNFTTFKTNSNAELAALARAQYWKVVYTNAAATSTNYIYVWKVTASAVYFLYQQTVESNTTYSFIKMTQAFNGEMIDDLRVQKCDKTVAVTQSSTSITVKFTDVTSTEGTDNYKTTTTYTANSTYPAFFGAIQRAIAKKKLDTNGNVASTQSISYNITYMGNNATLNTLYTDYTAANRKYCVHKYVPGPAKSFTFPFTLNCEDAVTPDSNPSTDTTLNFDPTTEL
jgi:hypothetical protein